MYYPLLNERIYQLNKPELIEEVFIKKQCSSLKMSGRRMMAPEFHQKRIESYRETMVEVANRYIDIWKEGEERE